MNFKISIIKNLKENQSCFNLFLIFLFILTISSCTTIDSSNPKSSAKLELYEIEIDKDHPYLTQIYYRDIFSFSTDNIVENMIVYDAGSDTYYAPGKTSKIIKSGSYNIEFVNISTTLLAGFSCVGHGIILYSDNNGSVFKIEKNSNGKWEEKHLFNAKIGQKPFTSMAADQKNIYFYSHKDNGVYRFDYSGKATAFIKIKEINVTRLDVKSNYLYMLNDSGSIILADYKQNRTEIEYKANDRNSLNTMFLVRQTKTETEIILNRDGKKDSLHYAIYPLSHLHRMVVEEGYIKRVSPPIAKCSHVLSDSNGKIIFPVTSTLIDLDTALSRKVTVTGMIHDIENRKIVVVSAIDN
ncbi:MAG: hypothetical protein FWE72_06960 [Spirochaetaceae bacterium]|nr:hypothetical protein [Spirochaetaceae bacterium]